MDAFGLQPDAASYMSLAEAKGYVGITFLYHHETDEMVIAWAGTCVEEMIKSDTENSLLDVFQESFHSVQVNSVNTDIDRKPVTEDLTDVLTETQEQGPGTIWLEDVGEGSYLKLPTLGDDGTEASIKLEVEVEELEKAGSTSELSPDVDYDGETMAELEECASDESMNGSVQESSLSQDMYVRDVVVPSSATDATVLPLVPLESSDVKMEDMNTSTDPELRFDPYTLHYPKISTEQNLTLLKEYWETSLHRRKLKNLRASREAYVVTAIAGSDSTCKICEKKLASKGSLKSHMRLHTKPFECPVCQERFPWRSTYENHCKTHGIELEKLGIFRCIECRRLFDTQHSLEQHMKLLHDDQPLHFPECNQGFDLLKKMNKHIKDNRKCSSHNPSSLTDSIPSEDTAPPTPELDPDFETRTNEQNASNAEEEDIVQSDGQAEKSPTKRLVIAMKFTKSKKSKENNVPNAAERKTETLFHLDTCPVCKKQFATKNYLKDHMKMHSGEKAFHCTGCSKSFTFRASLKHHLTMCKVGLSKKAERKTEIPSYLVACPVCKKQFTSENYLKDHMKMHRGEKTYHCNRCSKSFTSQSNLLRHLTVCKEVLSKTDTKAKIHSCPKCTKSFSSEAYLKHHIKIHTGEKSHRCMHCGASFTFQASLTHHLTKVDGCMKKMKT